jgi:hypothetical protein
VPQQDKKFQGGYQNPFPPAVSEQDYKPSEAGYAGDYQDPHSDEAFEQDDYDGFWNTSSLTYKKAYNMSLGGLIKEIQTGKSAYNVDHIDQSMMLDAVAMVGSMFASKEDLALLAGSRGIGTIGLKGALLFGGKDYAKKQIIKHGLAKSLVSPSTNAAAKKRTAAFFASKTNMSRKTAIKFADDVFDYGLPGMAMYGNHEGLRLATLRTRDSMIESGVDFSKYEKMSYTEVLEKVKKNTKLSDFGKGYALGGVGTVARLSRFTPLANYAFKGKTGELTAMGLEGSAIALSMRPIYEGTAPQMQDMIAAGALVAGTRLGNTGVSKISNRIQKVKDARLLSEAFEGGEEGLNDLLVKSAKEQIRENKINVSVRGASKEKKGVSVFEQIAEVRTGAGKADKIIGLPVTRVGGKNKNTGKPYQTIIVDKDSPTAVANYDILASANVDIGSIKQTKKGTTMEITMITAPKGTRSQRYFLDEKNTSKFFDYFAETDNVTVDGLRIANSIATIKQLKNSPTILREIQIAEFKAIKRRMSRNIDDYTKDDFREAVLDTADQLSGSGKIKHPFVKLVENGQVDKIKVENLDSATRTALVENMYNRNQINRFVKDAKRYQEDKSGLMFQTIGGTDRDNNSSLTKSMLKALGPFYYTTKDPIAKRLVRTLQAVNRGTNQKVQTRLDALGLLTRGQLSTMNKKVSQRFEDYLGGQGEVTGFKDFRIINSQDKGTVKRYVSNIRRKANKLEGEEKDFQTARANFLEGVQKVTDDVYVDAQGVLPRLQDYVEGYIPVMFRKDVLDTLTDGNSTIAKKRQELLDRFPGVTENADDIYPEEFVTEFSKELTKILRTFEKSKFKGETEFVKIFNQYKYSLQGVDADINDFQVYKLLELNAFNRTLKPFSPLEKPRKFFASFDTRSADLLAKATDDLLEQDVRQLLGNYIAGASKRIEFAKAFGADGKLFNRMASKIGDERMPFTKVPDALGGQDLPLMQHNVKDAVKLMKQVFTGEINYNRNTKHYGQAIQAFQSIGNIQMGLKIGLGTAFIPNLTQTVISTAMELGPVLSMKSIAKLYVPGMQDVGLQRRVAQSGATLVNTIEEMLNYSTDYARMKGTQRQLGTSNLSSEYIGEGMDVYRKKIERGTEKSATIFSIINKGNQTVAAATFEEAVVKLGRILAGKKSGFRILDTLVPEKRQNWARRKLESLGMDPEFVVKNLDMIQSGQYEPAFKTIRFRGRKKKIEVQSVEKETMLRGMQRFATRTQLQRDFTLDPYLFNDPIIKPLLLFKRFGPRQAFYAMNVVEREFIDGNVVPFLTLTIGGTAAGSGVIWAKEQLFEFLTGAAQYFSKDERQKITEGPDFKKLLNNWASAGSFGMVTDIIGNDDPLDSIGFLLTPVIVDDIVKFIGAIDEFYDLAFNEGMKASEAGSKSLSSLSRVFGSVLSRQINYGFGVSVGEHDFRTPGLMTEGAKLRGVQQKRRDTISYIKKLMTEGQPKKAYAVMRRFNETYGVQYPKSGMISYNDVSYNVMMKDKLKQITKEQNENKVLP